MIFISLENMAYDDFTEYFKIREFNSVNGNKQRLPIATRETVMLDRNVDYNTLVGLTLESNFNTEDIDNMNNDCTRYLYKNKLTDGGYDRISNLTNKSKRTIQRNISKMLKADCNILTVDLTKNNGACYKIQYLDKESHDGFVTVNIEMLEGLISAFSSNAIKVYLTLCWILKNGKPSPVGQKYLASTIGLHTDRPIAKILKELHASKYIKMSCGETKTKDIIVNNQVKTVPIQPYIYQLCDYEEWKKAREID
ncbi:hypothetical protein [Clostridioides difficile]|uniref:hypothetical protein n=1 Tax=Clostridioides difficile TaxID=1496 RepID=UPI0021CA56BF|nr:hypothetical protein [Clostridioides difficile]UUV16804.1 hypothetical protein NQ183_20575 [Clostridioides difficile]